MRKRGGILLYLTSAGSIRRAIIALVIIGGAGGEGEHTGLLVARHFGEGWTHCVWLVLLGKEMVVE